MGHLINPVAFRLGWSKSWVDNFYVDNLYYPQFMHMILRIRLYLLYFFRQPNMRKFAYFYSHFNIANHISGLSVQIFYYDGRLENHWDEFVYQSFSSRMRYQVKVYDRFVFQRFYLLLLLLLLINSLVMSRIGIKGFIKHFLKKRSVVSSKLVSGKVSSVSLPKVKQFKNKNIRPRNLRGKRFNKSFLLKRNRLSSNLLLAKIQKKKSFAKANFVLFTRLIRNYFILYLHRNANYGKRRWSRATWDYLGFGQTLFYMALTYFLSRPFFYHIGVFLEFVITKLSNFSLVKVSFFLLSNNHVTASFLANYIGKRLRQGYRLTELINPLRRELVRVRRASQARFRHLIEKANKPGLSLRLNYASVFSSSLFLLFKAYRQHNAIFFKMQNTFVNHEFILMLFFLARQLFSNSYKNFFSSGDRARRLGGFVYNFYAYQVHFLFFYKSSRTNLYGSYLFLPLFFPKSFSLATYPDYYIFLREMNDSFAVNFSVIQGVTYFSFATKNMSSYPIYKAIAIGFSSFLRYLRFDMMKFNVSFYYNLIGINKKNQRSLRIHSSHGLLGFKFHLKGRFTRKQIAASHIFRRGPLPLSTVNASIDYAFNTVPLKNSAVGIKVWLYKANRFYTFFFKVL